MRTQDFLIFFRISIAVLVWVHLLSFFTDMPFLYGEKSLIPNTVTNFYVSDAQLTLFRISEYLNMDPSLFWVLFLAVFSFFALLLLLGLCTQLSALFLLLLHVAMMKNNVFFNYGVDYYTNICLFFLCFLPSNTKFSLDRRLFPKLMQQVYGRVNYALLRTLFRIFVCISYFFSGFDKLLGYNWRNGESIWKTFTLPYANLDFNIEVAWLSEFEGLLTLVGWSVIVLELGYGVINLKPLRKFWLWSIISMHLGIALILNLYFFSAIMIVLNLTAYFDFEKEKKSNLILPQYLKTLLLRLVPVKLQHMSSYGKS